MGYRTLLLGLASAVTTFLVIGPVAMTVLGGWYGEAPGIGILAVTAGLLTGLTTWALVTVFGSRLTTIPTVALVAYATFGVTFLGLVALRYVNVPSADEMLTFPIRVGFSLIFTIVTAVMTLSRHSQQHDSHRRV